MSLEAAINTPEGDFIRGGFSGNISDAKAQPTKKGGVFWKAKIRDGQFEADLTCFARTFEHVQGQRVTFSGMMCLSRKPNYNGRAQITIGDKAKWDEDGGAAPAAPVGAIVLGDHSRKTQAYPTPVTQTANTRQTVTARTGMTAEEMAATWANVANAAYSAFIKADFPQDLAQSAALKAPEWAALWWFGEKSVRVGNTQQATPQATQQDDSGDVPF